MTPLDEAPEQRWRRTVDRRNRPAKLKVDRLLRDFGYAELDSEVGDAIEARLAGVALAVAPSLRDAVAGEVVTIYASDSVAPQEAATAPEPGAIDPGAAEEPAVVSDVAQMVTYLKQQVLDARAEAERLRTELDRRIAARMDAERENEAIIAEQAAALEAQGRQLAELREALDGTRRALAETRDEIRRAVGELQALPEPVPADVEADLLAADEAAGAGEDATDDFGLAGEGWADGADEPEDDRDEPALTVVEPVPTLEPRAERRDASMIDLDEPPPDADEAAVAEAPDPSFDLGAPALGVKDQSAVEPDSAFDLDEPALGAPELPAAEVPDSAFDLDEPALGAPELPVAEVPESAFHLGEPGLGGDEAPVGAVPEPSFDLGEPGLGGDEAPVGAVPEPSFDLGETELGADDAPVAEAPESAFHLDEPALGPDQTLVGAVPDPPNDLDDPALMVPEDAPADGPQPELDLAEPVAEGDLATTQAEEFDLEPRPRAAETPAGDWQPDIPPKAQEPETRLHAASEPEEFVTIPSAQPEPSDDLDSPLPPASDWLPADLRPPSDPEAPAPELLPVGAGEPEGELTDFDDFLYDDAELYVPGEPEAPAGGDGLLEHEIEARWPDEPADALPPPPPAPPSPFGDELAPESADVAERPTLGKVLRGRGGRGRGRWEGRCSICGREPQVNRRKDLQAAGWDLDDDAAACPQCRGVG